MLPRSLRYVPQTARHSGRDDKMRRGQSRTRERETQAGPRPTLQQRRMGTRRKNLELQRNFSGGFSEYSLMGLA